MTFKCTAGPRVWTRIGVLVIITGSLVSGVIWGIPDVNQLRSEIAQAGTWAPWVSVLVFAAASLGPVPKNALATTTGTLFGIKVGVAIVVTGALLSAMLAFVLARTLARETVARLDGPRWTRFEMGVRRHGLVTVIVARLSPIVPFTVFNYTAGMTSIGANTFFIGTAVGIVPGSVVYVALGSYGGSPSAWWPAALTMVALIFLLVPVCRVLNRYWARQLSVENGRDRPTPIPTTCQQPPI